MFQLMSQWFWNERIWLGSENRTWEQYEKAGYRHFNDIYYSIYTGIVFFIIGFILKRYVFTLLGLWLGIQQKKIAIPFPNLILEKSYCKFDRKIPQTEITGLGKQLDLSVRQIEQWLRLRKLQDRHTLLLKFADSAYKFSLYAVMFVFGLIALWDKPCLWDSDYCFIGYPKHYVPSEIWWYYNLEMGIYLSFIISLFFDHKRKDFWIMVVHHNIALILLVESWAINCTRIGSFIILIHDISDIPLEFSKMTMYLKKISLALLGLVLFTMSWMITRLVLLPYRVYYHHYLHGLRILPEFPAENINFVLLATLQILHIAWTYFIIRIVVNAFVYKKIADVRSDDEDDDE